MRKSLLILAMLAGGSAHAANGLENLAWLIGDWIEDDGGVVTRETWLAPTGGAMASVTQTSRPGQPPRFEFATITQTPAGLTFTARIDGQPPTAFVATRQAPEEVVFENRAHDFPQRVIYRRCQADICARIEGIAGGTEVSKAWRYIRAPSP